MITNKNTKPNLIEIDLDSMDESEMAFKLLGVADLISRKHKIPSDEVVRLFNEMPDYRFETLLRVFYANFGAYVNLCTSNEHYLNTLKDL